MTGERYGEFYDIEMACFNADLEFYVSVLPEGGDILELGCGSGRLTRALAARGYRLTGVDISQEMLARALGHGGGTITYLRLDMAEIALHRTFDAVLIPYNTAHLLVEPGKIERCLHNARKHLREDGLLLLQVFLPESGEIPAGRAKSFQFRIFPTPEGGKIIKETLRSHSAEEQLIVMQERYRVRPLSGKKEDLAHTMRLRVPSHAEWTRLLAEAGFAVDAQYGDYALSPFVAGKDSLLLLAARATAAPSRKV